MIHVICATIREQQAKRIIDNLLDTSLGNIHVVVGLYRDLFDTLVNYRNHDRLWISFEEYSPSYSYAVNAVWGKLRNSFGIDHNLLALSTTDDSEYKTGWYEALGTCYDEQFPDHDGLMFLNDLRAEEMKVPNIGENGISLKSAKFCDKHMGGWLESPHYHCNSLDLENAGVAKLHGKCGFCPDAKTYHLLVDFDIQVNSEQYLIATDTFKAREKRGFIYDIIAPWRYWE